MTDCQACRWAILAQLAIALVFAGCTSASRAATAVREVPRERMVIATRTVDLDNRAQEPATVTGWLKLPDRPGPAPAVIVAHGCYGDSPDTDRWTSELRRMGYAALAVDSFTGRGVVQICTGDRVVSIMSRVHDVYRALSLLAQRPCWRRYLRRTGPTSSSASIQGFVGQSR